MTKHGKVLPFRRHGAKRTARRRWRWGRILFPLTRLLAPAAIVGLLLIAVSLGMVDEPGSNIPESEGKANDHAVRVTWVDGDSGRLDGQEFRLHGVDAPEGSPQRAKCPRERELSSDAREAARNLTEGRSVSISRRYEQDEYGREIVDLVVDGMDVASQLVAAGKLKRWNFDGGERKPDWC